MTEKRAGYKSLGAENKVTLIVWLKANRELCSKHDLTELTKLFSEQTGITASASSVQLYKNAIYPELKRTRRKKPVCGKSNGGRLLSLIADLDKRLKVLEEALQ